MVLAMMRDTGLDQDRVCSFVFGRRRDVDRIVVVGMLEAWKQPKYKKISYFY